MSRPLFIVFFTLNGLSCGVVLGCILKWGGVKPDQAFDPRVMIVSFLFALCMYLPCKRLAQWEADQCDG